MRSMAVETHEIPATVMAVLTRTSIKIVLLPGVGMADGGIPVDIPIDLVPFELRIPNSLLTVTVNNANIVAVRSRDAGK
jgi:hypothetical protein